MTDILMLLSNSHGQHRRLAWRTVSALAWALWTTRNKMTIEGMFPSHHVNYIFKWPFIFGSGVLWGRGRTVMLLLKFCARSNVFMHSIEAPLHEDSFLYFSSFELVVPCFVIDRQFAHLASKGRLM